MLAIALAVMVIAAPDPFTAPPGLTVEAAKASHDKTLERARESLLAALSAVEEKTRTGPLRGEAKASAVARLKAEREAFEATGRLPRSTEAAIAVRLYLREIQAPRADLLKAFDRAIDTATRAKEDNKANELAAEVKELKAVFTLLPAAAIRVSAPTADELALRAYALDSPKYLAGKTWELWRATGEPICALVLRADGTIQNGTHPNNTRWAAKGGRLTFYHSNSTASSLFDTVWVEKGKVVLGGPYLYDTTIYHILKEK